MLTNVKLKIFVLHVELKWDFAHLVNLAEEKCWNDESMKVHLDIAQAVSRIFRRGKSYHEAHLHCDYTEQRCVFLAGISELL